MHTHSTNLSTATYTQYLCSIHFIYSGCYETPQDKINHQKSFNSLRNRSAIPLVNKTAGKEDETMEISTNLRMCFSNVHDCSIHMVYLFKIENRRTA